MPGPAGSGSITAGTRLSVAQQRFDGADGSSYAAPRVGFRDAQLGIDCSPQLASDGKLRCLPVDSIYASGYFGDSGCTQPLAEQSGPSSCAAPTFALLYVAQTCGGGYRVFPVGAQYTNANVWVGSPAACAQAPRPPAYTLYSLGVEEAAASFVAFTAR